MAVLVGILLGLLALLGGRSSSDATVTPAPEAGSIRVIARACPDGVTAAQASTGACPIWPGGAALMLTDPNGNAWGMNAGRDDSLPGSPNVYSLDGLAFNTYTLGAPELPAGYASYVVSGAESGVGGTQQVTLSAAHPHAELVVYFLKTS